MNDYAFLPFLLTEELYHLPERNSDAQAGKEILLVSENVPLSVQELELLNKILGALKLSVSDAEVVGVAALSPEILQGRRFVVAFLPAAVALQTLKLSVPYVAEQQKEVRLLGSDPLSVLISDTGKKKQLWEGLKKMFEIR